MADADKFSDIALNLPDLSKRMFITTEGEEATMTEHHGSCHCGRIRLTLCDELTEVSECNCSICRRTAGLWHHCSPDLIVIEGKGVAYQQGDRSLDTWHCPDCGCTTHWTATDPAYARMAVNLRMFEPDLWLNLPRRPVDGASY